MNGSEVLPMKCTPFANTCVSHISLVSYRSLWKLENKFYVTIFWNKKVPFTLKYQLSGDQILSRCHRRSLCLQTNQPCCRENRGNTFAVAECDNNENI